MQYRTFKDLYLYCYHVASVVGLVCIQIFGYRDPERRASGRTLRRCVSAHQHHPRRQRRRRDGARLSAARRPAEVRADPPRSCEGSRSRRACARCWPWKPSAPANFTASAHDLIPLISEDSQPALWVLVTIYRALARENCAAAISMFSATAIRLSTFEKLTVLGKGFLKRLT